MFKLKHTRRIVAGLAAVGALAGSFGPAIAAPERAVAATPSTCGNWEIPSHWSIGQLNGYNVSSYAQTSRFTWYVQAWHGNYTSSTTFMYGSLHLTRFDTTGWYPKVTFTIWWNNGAVGDYSGTITDLGGFGALRGTATHRATGATSGWWSTLNVRCLWY